MRISDWSSDVCSSDLLRAQANAFIIAVDDQVDHAADRVRTPGRRSAAGDDVDIFDHDRRHGIQIVGHQAPAVDQEKRTLVAETANIDRKTAGSDVRARRYGRLDRKSTRLNSSH